MAKKSGKSGKAKDNATDKTANGFTIGGIDIPAALRSNGVTVETLTRHPLVAGLAAMALETLASQIRAKAAAVQAAAAPTPANADGDGEADAPAPRKKARKTATKAAAKPKPKPRAKPAS